MARLLVVAHAPLASALKAVAEHVYPDCGPSVAAVDVPAACDLETARGAVEAALLSLDAAEVLVLTDVFGATPCNAALAAVDGLRQRVVAGVNVPMLWRALCYADCPLDDLVARAISGGTQGALQVAVPRRQEQPCQPRSHDQAQHHHQQ